MSDIPALRTNHDQTFEAERTSSTIWRGGPDNWCFGDSFEHYFLAYYVDGLVRMWKATGATWYLDQVIVWTRSIIASATLRSIYDGTYYTWIGSDNNSYDPKAESYYWRYICLMLYWMSGDATLLATTYSGAETYQDVYDELLAFTVKHIWEKWWASSSIQWNMYRSRTHMTAHWSFIAMVLEELDTDPTRLAQYLELYQAYHTEGSTALTLRSEGQYAPPVCIRNNLTLVGGAYLWSDYWGVTYPPSSGYTVQDVSHGNNCLAEIEVGLLLGKYWTATDRDRFAETFWMMYDEAAHKHYRYVDGSGGIYDNQMLKDGGAKWAQYDQSIYAELRDHYTDDSYVAPYWAQLVYAAYILEGGDPGGGDPGTGQTGTLSLTVVSSADDANEYGDGTFSYVSTACRVESSLTPADAEYKCSGIRLRLNVDQGANVTEAYGRLYIAAIDDVACDIYAEAVDNSADFATTPDIIGRTRTTASVPWVASNLTADGANEGYVSTPDLSAVIQEVVDRPGWTANSYITILFIAREAVNAYMAFRSVDNAGGTPPQMVVTVAEAGSTPQEITLGSAAITLVGVSPAIYDSDDVSVAGVPGAIQQGDVGVTHAQAGYPVPDNLSAQQTLTVRTSAYLLTPVGVSATDMES